MIQMLFFLILLPIILYIINFLDMKIYKNYYKYDLEKLLKLKPFQIEKMYNLDKKLFNEMINKLTDKEKVLFFRVNYSTYKIYLDLNKNNDILDIGTRVKLINYDNDLNNQVGVITKIGPSVLFKPGLVGNIKIGNNILYNVSKKNVILV